jgi:hypothetical protein
VQSATLAAVRTRHAFAVPMNATPIFKGGDSIVPRPEPPWLVEPEEQPVTMVPAAELTMLERHMAEPEHQVAGAELEHQTALAEVPEVPRLERTMPSKDATVVELEAWCRRCSFGPACPEKWREPKPRSPASAGCDVIANAATTAASTTILHIASLPDRASGAARDVPHRARRKSELRGPLWDSFRIGWSVGHALVHLPLLKAVEVEPTQQANVPQLKADGTADWLARRVGHTSNSKAIFFGGHNSRLDGLEASDFNLMSIGRARGI